MSVRMTAQQANAVYDLLIQYCDAPDAQLVVDAHNGPERWAGWRWNEYVDAAHRNGNMVTARLIECPAALPQRDPA